MSRHTPIALAGFLLLVAAGCSYDVRPDESLETTTRGATDQQIHDGSCEGSCGQQSDDGCWCDDQCESFGDCCGDYLPECAQPIQAECFDDSMCGEGERCESIEEGQCCPPNALCILSMPPCAGECVPVVPENECETDADCDNGYCELFATCAGLDCPPPPPNQCVTPDCNDDTAPVCLLAVMPECGDSEVLAVRDGCFSCVDARTCEAPEPPPVSCVAGSDCGEGMHCEFADGDCGGVGTCVEDFDVCYELYAPACGCDGETYDNDCFARASAGGVAHMGACEAPPPEGCESDADCDDGEVCTQVQCITAPCPPLCMPAPEPTCAGACGGQSDDGCWCDELCASYGDCCGDVDQVCD